MTLTKFFDALPLLSLIWAIHLLPAVVPAGYWLLHRKTARWTIADLVVLTLPYVSWAALFFSPLGHKGWGNLIFEPLFLGCSVASVVLARMILRPRGLPKVQSLGMCLFAMGIAAAIYWGVPLWDLSE
jgi:hypothetical protein